MTIRPLTSEPIELSRAPPGARNDPLPDKVCDCVGGITIPGMGDRDAPESVITMNRNGRSGWIGTRYQDRPEPSPIKYWLSTLPATATRVDLVQFAMVRWRI